DYNRGNDSLTFTNIGVDDLTLGRDGNNLVVSLNNGEEITINHQLDENTRHSIDAFVFDDGTTWDQQAIRNRMVADQKATGTVVGTDNNENYTHSLGDGSYSVTDYDYHTGNDTFQFVDVSSTDILVQRLQSDPNDVVMTLANNEQITFLDQLHSSNDYGIESFEFADGVTWNRNDLSSAPIVEDEFVFV
ncbi:calcium-binding protein, partial [Phaeobacter sp. B1627]|uniref:calcium-binding protein n=1 Tax=Phaeobacter sp. B1627 TaxID=2583809 RepID=UPI00111849C4